MLHTFKNVIVISRYNIPDTNSCFIVLSKPFLYVVLLKKNKNKKKAKTNVTVSYACYTNLHTMLLFHMHAI